MDAVMPYNFNNGNGLSYKSQDGGISRTSDVMSQAEQQYISQYYALQ